MATTGREAATKQVTPLVRTTVPYNRPTMWQSRSHTAATMLPWRALRAVSAAAEQRGGIFSPLLRSRPACLPCDLRPRSTTCRNNFAACQNRHPDESPPAARCPTIGPWCFSHATPARRLSQRCRRADGFNGSGENVPSYSKTRVLAGQHQTGHRGNSDTPAHGRPRATAST